MQVLIGHLYFLNLAVMWRSSDLPFGDILCFIFSFHTVEPKLNWFWSSPQLSAYWDWKACHIVALKYLFINPAHSAFWCVPYFWQVPQTASPHLDILPRDIRLRKTGNTEGIVRAQLTHGPRKKSLWTSSGERGSGERDRKSQRQESQTERQRREKPGRKE